MSATRGYFADPDPFVALAEARAEIAQLRSVLVEIAHQKLTSELTEEEDADFAGAYDTMISRSRAAIATR